MPYFNIEKTCSNCKNRKNLSHDLCKICNDEMSMWSSDKDYTKPDMDIETQEYHL